MKKVMLKKPFNEDQSDIYRKINTKLDLLTENNELLKKQLKEIRNQNALILDALSENNVALKDFLKDRNPKYIKTFPINRIEELNDLERNINESNEKEYISSIRAIAGKRGLKKGLTDILSHKLLVDFNVEGSHNKQRLLNYPKFVNILFQGTYDENSSEKSFKNTLRDALKLAKNRFFKEKKSIEKAKISIDSPKDGDSEKVLQLTDNELVLKYPSIF
ncbi:uncharacterized protein LOC135957054 isoform X2 [Calliphora vicina]|uniref:uncharacterized protein LOC135957054 isoform X2 n=1 Tax=Calliphora vicina TaxID=7373 RepID=UPI00325C2389